MKRILIIGATSSIAEHCARIWAARGDALHLVARNEQHVQVIASDLKVVIDPANATGVIVAPKLLSALGVAHEVIHGEIDGAFPNHHPDPTVAANMKDLAQTVLANHADLGIGFDGDSDRIGVVDDKGRFISGDILTAIFANDILSNNLLNLYLYYYINIVI